MALTNRVDPYLNFRFLVEINGQVVAGFSDISSIECEIDTEEYQEGGVNDHVHHLLKAAKYRNLVLKRGLTDSDVLWKWRHGTGSAWMPTRLDGQGQSSVESATVLPLKALSWFTTALKGIRSERPIRHSPYSNNPQS